MTREEFISGYYCAILGDYGIDPYAGTELYRSIDWNNPGLDQWARRLKPKRNIIEIQGDWRVLQALHEALYLDSVHTPLAIPFQPMVDEFLTRMKNYLTRQRMAGLTQMLTLPLHPSTLLAKFLGPEATGCSSVPLVVDVVQYVTFALAADRSATIREVMQTAWRNVSRGIRRDGLSPTTSNPTREREESIITSLLYVELSESFVASMESPATVNTFTNSYGVPNGIVGGGPYRDASERLSRVFGMPDDELPRAAADGSDWLRTLVARARLECGLGPLEDLFKPV